MANYTAVFKRVEKKYLISEEQYQQLRERLEPYMNIDEYGLHNIYYDTDQYNLIRHSIEKPMYKEKLRVRSYGIPNADSNVFVEIKKKYNGVVYKRRISMKLNMVKPFVQGEGKHSDNS